MLRTLVTVGVSSAGRMTSATIAACGAMIFHMVRAQMGTPRKTLLKDADEAADLVLLPRDTGRAPSGRTCAAGPSVVAPRTYGADPGVGEA